MKQFHCYFIFIFFFVSCTVSAANCENLENSKHPTIYVATDGNDVNGDGTAENPYQSLEKAASKVKSNHTNNCILEQDIMVHGGSYPPQKFNNVISAANALTTIKLWPGTGRVIIDGTTSLIDLAQGNQWQPTSTANIYSLQLSKTDGTGQVIDIWQLFSNNKIMTPARWPNALLSDGSAYASNLSGWAQVDNGDYDPNTGEHLSGSHINKVISTPSADLPADLGTANVDASGGVAILNTGSWQSWARKVTAHEAGSNTIAHEESANTDGKVYNKGHMKFFVEGALGLMDIDQEWFFDQQNHIVYLYSDESELVDGVAVPKHWQTMRGKTEGIGLYSYGNEYIDIRNIDFFASVYKCISCDHVRLFSTDFMFGGSAKRMLKGEFVPENSVSQPDLLFLKAKTGTDGNFVLQNCTITDTDSQAFYIQANNSQVTDCYFNNIDYSAAKGYEPQGALLFKGDNNRISYSTLSNSGTSHGVVSSGGSFIVEYSELKNTGFAQEDGGAIQVRSGQQQNSVARYNWIHEQRQGKGIRMDAIFPAVVPEDYGYGTVIYNNVIWNSGGIAVKGRQHSVFNNTLFANENKGAGDLLLLDEKNYHPFSLVCEQYGCSRDSIVVNNLANTISAARNAYADPGISGWLAYYSQNFNGYVNSATVQSLLRNSASGDFRLRSTATDYIESGIDIPVNNSSNHLIDQQRSSAALEYGAYEYGMGRDYWIPGFRGYLPSNPIPNNGDINVPKSQDLIWRHAYDAEQYYVYLGTELSLVESATTADISGIYKGVVDIAENSYRPLSSDMAANTVYYWRVDTLKWGQVKKGVVNTYTTTQ